MVKEAVDTDPDAGNAWFRAMAMQLERSEKISPERMTAFSRALLSDLLLHATGNIPWYRERLKPVLLTDGTIDLAGWAEVPILTRADVIAHGEEMRTGAFPATHAPVIHQETSGSTGTPIVVLQTRLHQQMWSQMTARMHRWHGFDYAKDFASIDTFTADRAVWPLGSYGSGWIARPLGPAEPGLHYVLNMNTPVDRQVEWLLRMKPAYLRGFSVTLRTIAEHLRDHPEPALRLEGAMSYAGMLTPDTREVIHAGLGCEPADCYSSVECGYIGLQCPDCLSLLVQSEVCFVEVLKDDGTPCGVGETGRVIVTPLHNLAQPLIRYQLGDLATVGSPCGNGLPYPVLSRVLGRARNVFRFPGGRVVQPELKTKTFMHYLKPRHWQVAQVAPMRIEIRVVPTVDSSRMDFEGMTAYARQALGLPELAVDYRLLDKPPITGAGKHEDYVFEIPLKEA
ncbi:MAG: phenylacetate--CoA ligase family protein [Parvibaculaceae bacterium]